MATTSLSSPSSLNVSNTSDSTPSTATKTTTTKSSPVDEVVKFRGFKFRRTSCEGVGSGFGDSGGRSGVGDTGNRDLVSEVERSGIKNRDRSDAPDPDLNIDADSSPFLDSSAIGEHKVKRGDETMGGGGGGRGSGITKWKLQDETKMERGGWGGVRSGGPTKPHPQSRDKENVLTDFAHLIPSCRHNRICDVRMVKKSEGNRGRLYFSCTIPKNGKCDYFKWADATFPECQHGVRTLLRSVLKQGPNNGRKFFCCPKKKTSQCGFFQWAEGELVEAIDAHCKHSNISDLG